MAYVRHSEIHDSIQHFTAQAHFKMGHIAKKTLFSIVFHPKPHLHVKSYGFGGVYDLPFKHNGITWSVSRKAQQVFEDNRSGCSRKQQPGQLHPPRRLRRAGLNVSPFMIVPSELEDSMILLYAENEDYIPIFMDAPPEELWPDLAK